MSSSSSKSAATRTIQIAADIAPRAALLAAAAAKMGASDAAIEEVLTTPRMGQAKLSDEELINLMVESTQATELRERDTRLTPVMPEVIGASEVSRAAAPMPPLAETTKPAKPTKPGARKRRPG